jgi:hypothetical protein
VVAKLDKGVESLEPVPEKEFGMIPAAHYAVTNTFESNVRFPFKGRPQTKCLGYLLWFVRRGPFGMKCRRRGLFGGVRNRFDLAVWQLLPRLYQRAQKVHAFSYDVFMPKTSPSHAGRDPKWRW